LPVPDHEGCAAAGRPLAFTSAARMAEFIEAHGDSRWDVCHAALGNGLDALAGLHDSGYASLCVDPESDGTGGQECTLAELMMALRDN
jgi:hypothetical protein